MPKREHDPDMTLTIRPMICANCDCENDAGARYCSACGWSPEFSPQRMDQFVTSLPKKADVIALRPRRGRQAPQTSTQRHEGTALHPAPPGPRFTLPTSQPTRRWIEATRALEASFTAAAAEAEKKAADLAKRVETQIAAHKAEAARLRNAALVFTQLLQQVGIDAPASSTPERDRD